MARLTNIEMDQLGLNEADRIKYEYFSYGAVECIKALEKITLKQLHTLLSEFKKVVINDPVNANITEPILEVIRGKKNGYENPTWWAGCIFDECVRRYELWAEEELDLDEVEEDLIHYIVIPDGWYRSIH